jgi:hypothetical protein
MQGACALVSLFVVADHLLSSQTGKTNIPTCDGMRRGEILHDDGPPCVI